MHRADSVATFMCQLSENPRSLNTEEPSGPSQTCTGIALPFMHKCVIEVRATHDSASFFFILRAMTVLKNSGVKCSWHSRRARGMRPQPICDLMYAPLII